MFLRILEFSAIIIFILTVIFQVIIPLWKNLPIFPLINQSRTDLELNLLKVNEALDQQSLEDEFNEKVNIINNHNKEE